MVSSNHSRVARNCLSSSMILHPKLPLFHAIGVAHILRNQLGGGGFSNDYVSTFDYGGRACLGR